jgi:hypothetical protein
MPALSPQAASPWHRALQESLDLHVDTFSPPDVLTAVRSKEARAGSRG